MALVFLVPTTIGLGGVESWDPFWESIEKYQAGLGSLVGLFGLAAVTGWALNANRRQAEAGRIADRDHTDYIQSLERQREDERAKRRLVAIVNALRAENRSNLDELEMADKVLDEVEPSTEIYTYPTIKLRNSVYLSVLGEIGGLGEDLGYRVGQAMNFDADVGETAMVQKGHMEEEQRQLIQQRHALLRRKIKHGINLCMAADTELKRFQSSLAE